MNDVFTGLLLILWLAMVWAALNVLNLFAGAPPWVKIIASLVWFGIFLGGLFVLWKKPTPKEEPPPAATVTTHGANSPAYVAGRDLIVNPTPEEKPEPAFMFLERFAPL